MSTAEPGYPEFRPVSHAEMEEALRSCGLQHLTVDYDEYIQSDVVIVRDNQASDEQLQCVFRAQDMTGYWIEWQPELRERFYQIRFEVLRERGKAAARKHFIDRPELGPLPRRSDGQTDLDFIRDLERFCGPDAVGMFAEEFGVLTVSTEWTQRTMTNLEQSSKALACMRYAMVLAGIEFGFIGNEKEADAGEE